MGCGSSRGQTTPADKLGNVQSNQELLDTIQFLRHTPLFRNLGQEEFPALASACVRTKYQKGAQLVGIGEGDVDLYIVVDGRAAGFAPPQQNRSSMMRASMSSANLEAEKSWQAAKSVESAGSSDSKTAAKLARGLTKQEIMGCSASRPEKVATFREKDYFGEQALLLEESWSMTVLSESDPLVCLRLTQAKIQELGLSSKLKIPKRKARAPSAATKGGRSSMTRGRTSFIEERRPPETMVKTAEERALVRQALLACEALHVVLDGQGDELLEALCDVASKEGLEPGRVLVDPDDTPIGAIYIVQAGGLRLRPLQSAQKETVLETAAARGFSAETAKRLSEIEDEVCGRYIDVDAPSGSEHDTLLGPGELYGGMTLLYDTPHCQTVTAEGDTIVWQVDQLDYEQSMRLAAERRLEYYSALLSNIDAFGDYVSDERRRIAACFAQKRFPHGSIIYKEGDEKQPTFYVLLDGEVTLSSEGKEVGRIRGGDKPTEQRHFGSNALAARPTASSTTVTVISPEGCKCLCLPRDVINTIPELTSLLGQLKTRPTTAMFAGMINVESLEKITTLGTGAFGMVELWKDPATEDLYAIKTMGKAQIARNEETKAAVRNEKYILEIAGGSIFVTKLFLTAQTQDTISFVLDACLGGELYAVYWQNRLFGKEEHARFYTASVACGLEFLHDRFIAYRDLKPENCILDAQGRLKLTDMGLATFVVDKTYTTCGTVAYYAPEMVKQGGYTVAVDWWQLGIFCWELLSGKPPFQAATLGEVLFKLITQEFLADLDAPDREWPKNIDAATPGVKVFLKAMLQYEPTERVPMQEDGKDKWRSLTWFTSEMDTFATLGPLDMMALEKGNLTAPYLPPASEVTAGKKLANFSTMQKKLEFEPYEDDGTDWDDIF